MPNAHALISPSAAKRWIACPGSVRLTQDFPDKGSKYAAEGTFAHSVCETLLRHWWEKIPASRKKAELAALRKNEWYSEELEEYCKIYVDLVKETVKTGMRKDKSTTLDIEVKLDLTDIIPEGFGTGDAIVVANDTLFVFDFKYGRGVRVDARENPQMRCYAYGALKYYEELFDIKDVITTIVQPRVENGLSAEMISADELRRYCETVIKPAADAAFRGEQTFKPGEHCRFCPANGQCAAQAEENAAMMAQAFSAPEPMLLSDEELSQILIQAPAVEKWLKAVKDYALEAALNGVEIPGMKLVAGRSSRSYSDEEALLESLHSAGVEDALIYERNLLSPAKLEKLLGKKEYAAIAAPYVTVAPGKPTLVPETDKRDRFTPDEAIKNQFLEGVQDYED